MGELHAMLSTALITGVILAAFVYGVAPLIACRSNGMAAEPHWSPTELDALEPLASQHIRRLIHELDGHGFEVKANVTSVGTVQGATTIRLLLINQLNRCWIEAFYIIMRRVGERKIENWTVAIRTRFGNGADIVTASAPPVTAYPANPLVDVINPFWITDAVTLLAIHSKRVEHSPYREHDMVLPNFDEPLQFILAEDRLEMSRVTAAGYYRLDPKANEYVITAKGAYLMSWRLLWPLKGIRRRVRIREARRVLRKLGYAELATKQAIRANKTTVPLV